MFDPPLYSASIFSEVAIAFLFVRFPNPIFSVRSPLLISDGLTSPYMVILGITDICIDMPTTINGDVMTDAKQAIPKLLRALSQSHLYLYSLSNFLNLGSFSMGKGFLN